MEAKTLHKFAEGESGNSEDTSTHLGPPIVEKNTTSKQQYRTKFVLVLKGHKIYQCQIV